MTEHTGSASTGWLWSTNCNHHNGDFGLSGTRDIHRKATGTRRFVPFKPSWTGLDHLTWCYTCVAHICFCCTSSLSVHPALHGDTHLRVSAWHCEASFADKHDKFPNFLLRWTYRNKLNLLFVLFFSWLFISLCNSANTHR